MGKKIVAGIRADAAQTRAGRTADWSDDWDDAGDHSDTWADGGESVSDDDEWDTE